MQATLTDIAIEASHIKTFRFRPDNPLDYIAGQFVDMAIALDALGLPIDRRWFTLSSSPTESDIAITVRCTGDSLFKQSLQALSPGDTVTVSDAMGDFVLPIDSSIPLIWIAGGIGITPFRSMAKWMADTHDHRNIKLFHSVARKDEVIFGNVMKQAGIEDHTINESSTDGRLTAEFIISKSSESTASTYYISGPESFVADVSRGLVSKGLNKDRIITDAFLGYL